MTRSISHTLQAALNLAMGSVVMAVPFALGLSTAAALAGGVLGAIILTLGIAGTDTGGRGTLPLSALDAYDRGLAFLLLVAGVAFGLGDEPGAAAFFLAAGVAELLLGTTTRWSAAPG